MSRFSLGASNQDTVYGEITYASAGLGLYNNATPITPIVGESFTSNTNNPHMEATSGGARFSIEADLPADVWAVKIFQKLIETDAIFVPIRFYLETSGGDIFEMDPTSDATGTGPVLTHTVGGDHINDLYNEHGTLTAVLWLRSNGSDADTGEVGFVTYGAPENLSGATKSGDAWQPVFTADQQTLANVPANAAAPVDVRPVAAEYTFSGTGVEAFTERAVAVGGILTYQPRLILPPSYDTCSETLYYGTWLGKQVAVTSTPTIAPNDISATDDLTVTVESGGDHYEVSYPNDDCRIQRYPTADSAAVVDLFEDSPTGTVSGYVDLAPLNTAFTYRAWHGVSGTDNLTGYSTATPAALTSTTWILTLRTDDTTVEHVDIPMSDVTVESDSTAGRVDGLTQAQALYGTILKPVFEVTFTGTTAAKRATVVRFLTSAAEGGTLVLRGVHGEHHRVVPVGTVTETRMEAVDSPDGLSGGYGAAADVAYMCDITVTLAALT